MGEGGKKAHPWLRTDGGVNVLTVMDLIVSFEKHLTQGGGERTRFCVPSGEQPPELLIGGTSIKTGIASGVRPGPQKGKVLLKGRASLSQGWGDRAERGMDPEERQCSKYRKTSLSNKVHCGTGSRGPKPFFGPVEGEKNIRENGRLIGL